MYTICVRRALDRHIVRWHFEDAETAALAAILAANAGGEVLDPPSRDYITDLSEFEAWLRHDD